MRIEGFVIDITPYIYRLYVGMMLGEALGGGGNLMYVSDGQRTGLDGL